MSVVSGVTSAIMGSSASKEAAGIAGAASEKAATLAYRQWKITNRQLKPFRQMEQYRAAGGLMAFSALGKKIGEGPPEWEGSDYQKSMNSSLKMIQDEVEAKSVASGRGGAGVMSDVMARSTEVMTQMLPALKSAQTNNWIQGLQPLQSLAGMQQSPTSAIAGGQIGAQMAGQGAASIMQGGQAGAQGIMNANAAQMYGMNQAMQPLQQIGTQMLMNKLYPSGGSMAGQGFRGITTSAPAGAGAGFGGGKFS